MPVLGARSGETVVHIGADVFPVGCCHDLFLIRFDLHGNGKCLVNIIRRNSAVGSHTKWPVGISFRRENGRGDLVNIGTVQVLYLPEDGLFFPLPLCFKAGSDWFVLCGSPCLSSLPYINHAVITSLLCGAFL